VQLAEWQKQIEAVKNRKDQSQSSENLVWLVFLHAKKFTNYFASFA
jgi:hypothetical protein